MEIKDRIEGVVLIIYIGLLFTLVIMTALVIDSDDTIQWGLTDFDKCIIKCMHHLEENQTDAECILDCIKAGDPIELEYGSNYIYEVREDE